MVPSFHCRKVPEMTVSEISAQYRPVEGTAPALSIPAGDGRDASPGGRMVPAGAGLRDLGVKPFFPHLPECPPVSTAVPKSSTYSVREACSRHMEPIQPPAFTNTHCRSSSGRMWPGCFFRSSTMILENASSWSSPAAADQMG